MTKLRSLPLHLTYQHHPNSALLLYSNTMDALLKIERFFDAESAHFEIMAERLRPSANPLPDAFPTRRAMLRAKVALSNDPIAHAEFLRMEDTTAAQNLSKIAETPPRKTGNLKWPGSAARELAGRVRLDENIAHRPESEYRKNYAFDRTLETYEPGRWMCTDAEGWEDTSGASRDDDDDDDELMDYGSRGDDGDEEMFDVDDEKYRKIFNPGKDEDEELFEVSNQQYRMIFGLDNEEEEEDESMSDSTEAGSDEEMSLQEAVDIGALLRDVDLKKMSKREMEAMLTNIKMRQAQWRREKEESSDGRS
jgi:hypothetical protein